MTYYLTRSSYTKYYTLWPTFPHPVLDSRSSDITFEPSSLPDGCAISRDIQFLERIFPKLELSKKGGVIKVEVTEYEDGYFIREVIL